MNTFTLHRGTAPLLVSLPHDGTQVPDAIMARLTASARRVPDTDWHVARLYGFAPELGASLLVPTQSRYVVDLNRSEDDVSLYPGQNTTGLCPVRQFDGSPVYLEGMEPGPDEVRERVERYWRPYHLALRAELDRLHATHGRVVLWEAHSIRGQLPFLFEGLLPDLNLGTAGGASCSPELQQRLGLALAGQGDYGWVANGRFKGGHITRHYGRPELGVDAVQLEVSQRCYMDEATYEWSPGPAERLQGLLRSLLQTCLE
ncbi:N-formylglutamate deformylase [Luteimonas sp. MC1825]|uniref:N-formylglutamate deformylase n=1 Tax=Luteimonas sp. MC1825 TaxID=2761107 RepID=UPI001610E81E|nr:N-formylglutamate deformylase [Luteimonas sp. MC1825]MBB6598757.1 N-formylglutamate deformylase [Luteimonas sp. MC1825]QOC88918.1 N-formylglutamate deformylase [Luteimonas sp. MC1825]